VRELTFQFVAEIPPDYGRSVAMCTFRGRVLIACERGLLEVKHDPMLDLYRLLSVRLLGPDEVPVDALAAFERSDNSP
jgi:hypothetical protein